MKPTPRRLAVIAAGLCIALLAVGGYAQFQTGNIYGKVQAKDGSVLPGVTVTLTGVGAPQTTVTDSSGNFRFLSLSPGTYSLKADLAGYGTATRSGLGVRVATNADVTMTLNPSVSESITVTAEAPLLDVRKAGTGVNVSKVELEKIPTSRDPWTILQSTPGVQVDRLNVGGNQSGQQSIYVGKGADTGQNTWNVDGVNITDMAATGSSPGYYDFDAFEEMQITTGGSDPRIMTPGVQLNMVTKRGTNDFRGSGRYFYTPGSYQATPSVPEEAKSYLVKTNAINYVRDYGAEGGGPIWKDHIWGWLAGSQDRISNQNALKVGVAPAFDNIILRNKNAKLNGQLLPSNSAVGWYAFSDKIRNARSLSPSRPFETAWHQVTPQKIYKIEDTQIVGSSLYLTGMWSRIVNFFALTPNGGISDDVSSQVFRDLDNVWHGSFLYYATHRPQKSYRLDGSKFFDVAKMNHELKFGFGYRETPVDSTSGWPGPMHGFVRYRTSAYCAKRGVTIPADGQCMQAFFTRTANYAYNQKYSDVYLGDTILLGNLSIQAGLRWDLQKTFNTASASPANPIIGTPITVPIVGAGGFTTASLPGISYPGDARDLKWRTVEPRLGLTYALGGNKKTLLRAGYNRYVNQVGSFILTANPLGGYSYFMFLGNDKNHDKIAQRDELQKIQFWGFIDPNNPAAVVAATRVDYGMKPPHTEEFILGFEHELLTDFSIGVNFSHRDYKDLLETRAEHTQGKGDFFTTADYVVSGTAGGTLPNGEKFGPVTFYDLKNPDDVPTYFVIRNRPGYHQTFNGLELTASKRLSNRWMLRGNFSWNDWKEHSGANSFDDPTVRLTGGFTCGGNCNGRALLGAGSGSGAFKDVFLNAKWTYNITGLYQLPWDFSVGGSVVGHEGYPRVVRDEVTTAPGSTEVILNPVGSLRFANVQEIDLRAAKDFRFFNRLGITLSADLFNVANKRTILQRESKLFTDGDPNSDANQIREMQSPRVWRFAARFSF